MTLAAGRVSDERSDCHPALARARWHRGRHHELCAASGDDMLWSGGLLVRPCSRSAILRVRPTSRRRCDGSPGRHATLHANSTEHPIRSLEPGEDWSWCFVDQLAMRIPQVTGETSIPPSPMLS